jgi:hypothetical protein
MIFYHVLMSLTLRFYLAFFFAVPVLDASINIVLEYGTTSPADIASYGETFEAAETFWESNLSGYVDSGLNAPTQILINIVLGDIDGPGKTLGSAGPTFGNFGGSFVETTEGAMTFDTADLGYLVSSGSFEAVIRHEMGHVLGFGTLWDFNGYQQVYDSGTGQYTGAFGLAAFQIEFNQPDATYVPIELDGGGGTANGHWNMGIDLGVNYEVADSRDDPGDAIIYTSVNNGLSLDNELMTGFLTGEAWLSDTTLQSFRDIGYEKLLSPVPEPALFSALFGFSTLVVVLQRRRMPRRF